MKYTEKVIKLCINDLEKSNISIIGVTKEKERMR